MNDEKCRNRHVWSLLLRAVQIAFVEAAGSDEVAIYESAEDGAFRLLASHGLEGLNLERFRPGDGPVGRAFAEGMIWINPRQAVEKSEVTAWIPLRTEDSMIGAVVIFGPAKRLDLDVLTILASLSAAILRGYRSVSQ